MSHTRKSALLLERFLSRTNPIHFYGAKGEIETLSADELVEKAIACSWLFKHKGVNPGDVVSLMLPTSPEILAAIVGAWGCGATICILPHEIGQQNGKLNLEKLTAILKQLNPKVLVHNQMDADGLPSGNVALISRQQLAEAENGILYFSSPATSDDLAVIQMTSGSTGLPRGVMLRHAQIESNCAAIQKRANIDSHDHVISWLPLNHDMGLSTVTQPIWSNAELTQIPTERFLRSPLIWLETLSRQRGTISPAPTFAFSLLAKYAERLQKNRVDLSSWRYAWVGAEPIFATHLHNFTQAMGPLGLRDTVLKPAYGLAESVVAVSCTEFDSKYKVICVNGNLLNTQSKVELCSEHEEYAVQMVSNGRPIEGIAVKVADAAGNDVGEMQQGRILIAGDSITTGYWDGSETERFTDGWFDTGDLGFLLDGEIYISGRAKDLIIRGGVNVSPHLIEHAVENMLGLRNGEVAVFSHIDQAHSKEEVIVVASKQPTLAELDGLHISIAKHVVESVGIQIDRILFSRMRLPKTTSGKIQRNQVRQMYLNGEFNQ